MWGQNELWVSMGSGVLIRNEMRKSLGLNVYQVLDAMKNSGFSQIF